MQPSSVQRLEGGSTGAFRQPAEHDAVPEDQPTVISNRPPLPATPTPDAVPHAGLAHLVAGTRLAHFEVQEYVGGGGMGKVFRAIDTGLGRPVALKVLSPEQAAEGETLLRFRNEARNAARLNHDNIVQVYYVGEDGGLPFIAFEYVEGLNLRAVVEQKGPLSLAEAISYTLQVAEALAHAAERKVVHRDIKPSNVLITPEGRAKLIDMGLARLQRLDDDAVDLTASGVTLGTFDYISPEQARDPRNADVRSDIYSLGCTLFYMLSGRPPFPEGTVLQKLLQHQGDEPPDVRTIRPDLPEEVARVLRKMMAKDPRRRYQEPAKLILSLLSLAELVGLQPIGPGRTIWITPKEPRVTLLEQHLPWLAPIAAMVGIVFLLHLLWSSPAATTAPPAVFTLGVEEPSAAPRPAVASDKAPDARKAASATPEKRPANRTPEETPPAKPPKPAVSPAPAAAQPAALTPPSPATAVAASTGLVPSSLTLRNPLVQVIGAIGENRGGLTPEPIKGQASSADDLAMGLSLATPGDRAIPATGDATLASTPSKPSPAPASEADPEPEPVGQILVEDGVTAAGSETNDGLRRFGTLAAACAAAQTGETIELRYNGARDEKPVSLTSSDVTIRAGDGFHPTVVFRPGGSDPAKWPRAMFTMQGSRLTLSGLAVELAVPRDVPAESWSLVQMTTGQSIRLRRCWLTIRNDSDQRAAYHPDVAFVRVAAAEGAEPVMGDIAPLAAPPATIRLTDCVARGEAVLLKLDQPQPIDLEWRNGLLATSEFLLAAEGAEQSQPASESIELRLDRLTALVRGGLCRLGRSEYTPHQLPCRLRCSRSILAGGDAASLIEQDLLSGSEDPRGTFTWSGDHVYYCGFAGFWSLRQLGAESLSKTLTFDAWKSFWGPQQESLPSQGPAPWRRPLASTRPVHELLAADFSLAAADTDPAADPVTGMIPSRLLKLRQSPESLSGAPAP